MNKFIQALACLLLPFALFAQRFEVSYNTHDFKGPFSGKVLLFFSKDVKAPREEDFMIRITPYFATEVNKINPGQKIVFDDQAISYPAKLSEIERGEYYVQAVWDRDLGGRAIGTSPLNLYSKSAKIKITSNTKQVYRIECTEMVPEPSFANTEFVKEIKFPSKLLSAHQQKPISIDAALLLPKDYYKDPTKKFPLLILVSGYGGDYHRYSGRDQIFGREIDSTAFITLFLDGNCRLGHSVYANSDNNGPWGDALVKELIPDIENNYRCNGFRVLNGHSSGGWTVMWLQTHYPETFQACWSSSPDPVDFRSFQKINLYEDDNMFYNKNGDPNPVATLAGYYPINYMKDYYQMETVQYRGSQMRSFDAVFSAKAADGEPERLCDAQTGKINKSVVEHWKKYDISLYLRTNWASLSPLLSNKILITVGEQDNFLLNYPIHVLNDEMKKLNAAMDFLYLTGDHFTVASPEYWKKGNSFILSRYNDWLKTKN
jgi:enterochelin esterase-like enzyme